MTGEVPLPLLTCVHVKKDRSARSFQEWVEFSPYEIGIAKYGTFMPTGLFGSKFFMGTLCKRYEERPLHYLQGIWGSAFCILFKRLLENNRKLDPVEMIRQEMEKQLSESQQEDSTDSSDDENENDNDKDSEIGSGSNSSSMPRQPCNTGKECRNFFCYSHNGPVGNITQSVINNKEKNVGPVRSLQRVTARRTKDKSYWHTFLKGVFENKNFELLSTRAGRAGVIHNFMRGLSLQNTFPLSPFLPLLMPSDSPEDDFYGNWEMHPTDVKHLYMVDGGLTFNSPYPLVLRPQRSVDIILSFDFSARSTDSSPPFKELKLAEKWAQVNRLPFPPIDTSVMDIEGMKELYIFKHPTDPHCPIVMHFVLVNIEFRKLKFPGVEELDFTEFDIFDDPNTPYSTFNFKYTHKAFARLSKLTEFNTLTNIDSIKNCLSEAVQKKRTTKPKVPIALKDIRLLRKVSEKNKRILSRYISRVESGQFSPSDNTVEKNNISGPENSTAGPLSEDQFLKNQPLQMQNAGGLNARYHEGSTGSRSPRANDSFTLVKDNIVASSEEPTESVHKRESPGRRKPPSNIETEWYDAQCYSIDSEEEV